ncbi:multiple organellar RNA editing factor 1, mitochondrial-like [Euphorbia lathyris]|uniref:multiple organellar RNA editing factor 1, mitochondrial-like n=1 Tax=Euphorbia lathyris TaxID=212925 RepID=UPI003313468B
MALQSTRLRRGLTSLSALHRSLYSPVIQTSSPIPRSFIYPSPSAQLSVSVPLQSRSFTGSRVCLSSSGKQYKVYKEGDEITEDTVLFEGCDFNHWLITVDFPKDSPPTPEEMVATYERICAQGLNISIEEAKKKIYACSTTTYNGFQAVMTEEESERFKDVPGVVFVLPDSYIDPQNKQYGGDKYEYGVITPRPPPYQNKRAGRFNDRNRNPNQPRYDQRGGAAPNQGGNPQYNQQGHTQGGGNYGAPQSYPPRQSYGPPGQGERMPMNNNYQENRGGSFQGNYNQGQQGAHYPQDRVGGPYQGRGQQGAHYPQAGVGGPYQGQGQQQYPQVGQRNFRQDTQNFSPGHIGTQEQGANAGYRQGYPAEDQSFSQMGQKNKHGEQPPYPPPMGQTGTNQVRY